MANPTTGIPVPGEETKVPFKSEHPVPSVEVDFRAVTPKKNLVGFVDLKIAGTIAIKDVRVLTGENGIFTNMPSVQNKEGKYVELCNPITREMHDAINGAVSTAYTQAVERAQGAEIAKPDMTLGKTDAPISVSVSPKAASPDNRVMGFAQMNISDHFVVKSIKLVSGKNGLFPAVPTVPDGMGGYKPICEMSGALKNSLHKAVRDGYKQAFEGKENTVSLLGNLREKGEKVAAQKEQTTQTPERKPTFTDPEH